MGRSGGDVPVALQVMVRTPSHGTKTSAVPINATTGQFVTRTLQTIGAQNPSDHVLQTAMTAEEGNTVWHTIDPEETLLDALRGVQKTPRIVHETEVDAHDNV